MRASPGARIFGERKMIIRYEQNWIYHPTEEAKIVGPDEYEQLLKSGWYSNPKDCQPEKKEEADVVEVPETSFSDLSPDAIRKNYEFDKANKKSRKIK